MKNTTAKRLSREDLKQLPDFTKIWVSCVMDEDGVLWHWTAPGVVFNSGNETPVVPCDFPESVLVYQVTESFAEMEPDVSFWDSKPAKKQLQGISQEEFNSLPDEITFNKLAHEITGRGMSFKTFCECAGLDLDEFNLMITGQRKITHLSEVEKIGKALDLDGIELIELFAS